MYLSPIIVYPILAVLLPLVFFLVLRRFIWLSPIPAVIIEVIIYRVEFFYYESRPLMILFTALQVVVMAVIILILTRLIPKLRHK